MLNSSRWYSSRNGFMKRATTKIEMLKEDGERNEKERERETGERKSLEPE